MTQQLIRARPSRAGRGGVGRSPYNERGERLDAIMRQQGRRYEWLLEQLKRTDRAISRPTLYRARLPEDDPLYLAVGDTLWVAIAGVLRVHPSELLGRAAQVERPAAAASA